MSEKEKPVSPLAGELLTTYLVTYSTNMAPRFPGVTSAGTMLETKLVLHGTFIDTPSPGELRVREDTLITVDIASGRIQSIAPRRSSSSSTPDHEVAGVERLTLGARRVVVPGFVDCVRSPPTPTYVDK
jgi:hypothetical protein